MAKTKIAKDPAGSNQPSNLPNDQQEQHDGNAEGVPRTDHTPVEKQAVTAESVAAAVRGFHVLAKIFPKQTPEEFAALCADIAKNGLTEPITTYKGEILDGSNRDAACRQVGVEPVYVEYDGDDPLAFVLAKNLHRRHLTTSQRAMSAARLANLPEGRPELTAQNAVSQEDAAKMLNVSRRSVQDAHKICTKAIPEVAAAVEAGLLSVSAAAKLADATEEQQREAIEMVERGEKCPSYEPESSENPEENTEESKPQSLKKQLTDGLKKALEYRTDTTERSDELMDVFKVICDEKIKKNKSRKEFLQGVLAECAEYGVKVPVSPASSDT
jgi:ParB-like chromosome segregation protein Spo0J